MRFQYEVISAEGKGVPVRCAFLACVALCVGVCVVSCALAASCVAPARAHASAPGPGIEMSADNGGVAVSDGAPAEYGGAIAGAEVAAGALGDAGMSASAVAEGAGEPVGVTSGEQPANAAADVDAEMPEVAEVVGDAGWKTQLGAWVLASNPDAVEVAVQQARVDAEQAKADAAAKAELPAASDRASAVVALALANLAAGLVMLAVGRMKSRSTR